MPAGAFDEVLGGANDRITRDDMAGSNGKVFARTGMVLATALFASALPSHAQRLMNKTSEMPASFTAISPIFGQLVSFSMPSNFVVVFENENNGRYTREAVLKGETAQQWSQMITVTGAKGLAGSPDASAENFAGSIAAGFRHACPDSFAAKAFGATKFGEHDGFVAVVGCGRVGDGTAAHSETALLVAIKGSSDVYTLQWAERGAALDKANVDDGKWHERFKLLSPIKLCPIIPGEKPPYPSCLGKP